MLLTIKLHNSEFMHYMIIAFEQYFKMRILSSLMSFVYEVRKCALFEYIYTEKYSVYEQERRLGSQEHIHKKGTKKTGPSTSTESAHI